MAGGIQEPSKCIHKCIINEVLLLQITGTQVGIVYLHCLLKVDEHGKNRHTYAMRNELQIFF